MTEEADIKAAISAMWAEQGPKVQRCYEDRLAEREGLAGVWKLTLLLAATGEVASVRVHGETQEDAELEACVKRVMSAASIRGRLPKARPVTLPVKFGT